MEMNIKSFGMHQKSLRMLILVISNIQNTSVLNCS